MKNLLLFCVILVCLNSCSLLAPPPVFELSAKIEQQKLILHNNSSDTIYYWMITRGIAMVANYAFTPRVSKNTLYVLPNQELELGIAPFGGRRDELWITYWKKGKPLTQDTFDADNVGHITIPIGG